MRFWLDPSLKRTAAAGFAVTLAALSACNQGGTSQSPPTQQTAPLPASAGTQETAPAAASAVAPDAILKELDPDVAPRAATQPMSGPRKVSWRVVPLDTAGTVPRPSLGAAFIQAVQSTGGDAYRAQQANGSLAHFDNPKHGFQAELDGQGPRINQISEDDSENGHSTAWKLVRYGCQGDAHGAVLAARPRASEKRVAYTRGVVTEWYQNGPIGLEQGFDLRARPACNGAAELELSLDTDLHPVLLGSSTGPAIELRDNAGKALLHYSDLSAFDANGAAVPATMSLTGSKLVLRLEDRGARYPLHVDPLIWAQVGGAVKSSDFLPAGGGPVANDQFGTSVAVSGSTAVVGAPFCDDQDTDAGAAFIFTRTAPGQWMQQAELTVGVAAGAHLGHSVAIADLGGGMLRVVLGAPDDGGDGSATWFSGSAANWTFENTQGPLFNGGSGYGTAVAVSTNRIVIGSPGYHTNDGFVDIIELSGGVWTEVLATIAAAGSGELLGSSVGIDTNLAIAGAPHRGPGATNAGGYDIYWRNGTGTWARTSSQTNLVASALFGMAAALQGTNALFGAPGAAANVGSATVQGLNAANGLPLGAPQTLTGNGLAAGDMFGSAVAINGTLAAVGTPAQGSSTGNVYIFRNTAAVWGADQLITGVSRSTPTSAGELFGAALAINSTDAFPFVLVGAPGNGPPALSGAFYEFIQRGQLGDTCATDLDCASNFCVDAVCCNSACGRTGPGMDNVNDCQACAIAAGGSSNGMCSAARGGQVCQPGAPGGCDLDSICPEGSMVCPVAQTKPDGTVCTAGTCQGGTCRDEATLVTNLVSVPAVTTLQNPVTVTVTVLNNGPSPATQFQLQLIAPDGATLQNATGQGLTCQSSQGTQGAQGTQSTITCTGPDLASGASVMLNVTAVPPYTNKTFTITGTATSSTFDPGTTNSATLTINNSNPQSPVLTGGGFGCALAPASAATAAPALMLLALAFFSLLLRRRLASR